MENIKYGLFDLIVYTLPGSFFLVGIIFIKPINFSDPTSIINSSFYNDNFSAFQIIVFILFSHIIGFVINTIANYVFKLLIIIKNLFKKRKTSESKTTVYKSEKYTIVRQYSAENYKYIELWNVMKNFSISISFIILMLTIFYSVKFALFGIIPIATGIIVSFILLIKAFEFHDWVLRDLENAYQKNKDKS